MKMLRLILYIPILVGFIWLFDIGFTFFTGYLIIYYNDYIVDTFFWYIFKMFLFITVLGIVIYILHMVVGWLSGLISKISAYKIFNLYFSLLLLAINLFYWLYEIWFKAGVSYSVGLVILNLVLSGMIYDFSWILYSGHFIKSMGNYEVQEVPEQEFVPMDTLTNLTDKQIHDYKIIWGQNLTEEELLMKANEIVDKHNSRKYY